jgi:uncharacterized protein (TIGR02172 family)
MDEPNELGAIQAQGRTADIYNWKNNCILKLFHNWFDLDSIRYEQRMSRAVHASGLPVPDVKDLIQVKGRYGLIYERVDGFTMLDILFQQPWRVDQLGQLLANLQVEIHRSKLQPDFPSQRDRLRKKLHNAARLPGNLRQSLLAELERLPDGRQICHGDFHPGNVIMQPERAVIIDWIDASRGNPLADVARSTIIALGAAGSSQIADPKMKAIVIDFHQAYLHHYFTLQPEGRAEYQRWLPIVAGARLSENISEIESWLLSQAGDSL